MHTGTRKKLFLALTFWLALHSTALKAQILGPNTESSATFEFDANGIFSVTGTGTGTLSLSGGGTEMFWYPKKAAFRAGSAGGGTGWNDSYIGDYSVAFGLNTTASGIYSTASGYASSALGDDGSMATGWMSTASGIQGSTAIGLGASAVGNFGSTAIGYGTTASGNYGSTAIGNYAIASGSASTAFGYSTHAASPFTLAVGFKTTASGLASTASGYYSIASGNFSMATGYNASAPSFAELTIGQYNLGSFASGGDTTWITSDPLLELGNGTDSAHPADAFVVYKNGNAAFHGALRVASGGDLSMGSYTTGTPP